MTEGELIELVADCPALYHMAEKNSWPSIRDHGLLSTAGLLDLYNRNGTAREAIESKRRSKSVALEGNGLRGAVVRDQKPMDDKGLTRCLEDGMLPEEWYRTLNAKVFFWLTRKRLLTLLNAYQTQEHDVLTLDTRSLIDAYRDKIWLCPMNSGCTKPFPHQRGRTTFQRIPDYPYAQRKEKKRRGERVVELAVDYAVPDVAKFVTRVAQMKESCELNVLFQR